MTQSGGGDEDIGDADRRALVEQSGIETGGDPGAAGIKGQNLQGVDEAQDFGAFVIAMFGWRPVRALEELELGDDRDVAVFWAASRKLIDDFFATTQNVDADVGIEDSLQSAFSR